LHITSCLYVYKNHNFLNKIINNDRKFIFMIADLLSKCPDN